MVKLIAACMAGGLSFTVATAALASDNGDATYWCGINGVVCQFEEVDEDIEPVQTPSLN